MLNSKQRAFLRGLANSEYPIVFVGKGGVVDTVISGVSNAIKARELIKCKALENCPDSSRETADKIALEVGADVVQVIGRVFVLYKANPEKAKDADSVSYRLKKEIKIK